MSENPPIVTLPPDQMIAWYQHHVQVLQGYALALALRAGLSPEEAATVFIDPWHAAFASLPSSVTPHLLEVQAGQAAEVLALTYGMENVRVYQQEKTWLIEVTDIDPEPCERYGVSLELHSRWIAEQLRPICEAKGIHSSVWLEPERPTLHLSFKEPDH